MRNKVLTGLMLGCLGIAVLVPSIAVAEKPEPVALVDALYSHFKGDCSPEVSDLELLRAMAAPELASLLDREMACQRQGQICRYDFSVIVNGQDCQLSDLATELTRQAPEQDPRQARVTATFKNMGQPSEVAYDFSRNGDVWQLTDLRVAGEPSVSLLQLLR